MEGMSIPPVRQPQGIPSGGQFAPDTRAEPAIGLAAPAGHDPRQPFPGTHPVYGGTSWGIRRGVYGWSVSHGEEAKMLGGRMYVDDSPTPLAMTDTRWAALTDSKATAEQVWNRRHQINEALIGIGARPHDEFELFVRLNHDDSMTLFDEDSSTDRQPIQVPPPTNVPDLSNRHVRTARISVAQDAIRKAQRELQSTQMVGVAETLKRSFPEIAKFKLAFKNRDVSIGEAWDADGKALDRSYIEDASFSAVGFGTMDDYDTFIERTITVEDAHAWRPGT